MGKAKAVSAEGGGEETASPRARPKRTPKKEAKPKPEPESEPSSHGASEEEAPSEEAAPPAKRARAAKGASAKAKGKGKAKVADGDEEAAGEEADEEGAAPAKPKRARKASAPKADGEAAPKKGRAKKEPAPQLPVYTLDMRKPPPQGGAALKLLSWNVAGLRAVLGKIPTAISALVEREGAEVVCLQEHKLQQAHTGAMEAALGLQGWTHTWAVSTEKAGYSGVSVHTRAKPLAVSTGLTPPGETTAAAPDPEHEGEGRVVTVELDDVVVVNAYVPNSGEGLKRLDYRLQRWDVAFAAYLQALGAKGKPLVLTGDLNCAHKEIDIHAPKTNLKSAGFTPEERESFGRLLLGEVGLVDTFRTLFPDTVGYTYYTRRFNCREKGKGWRLDYFLTSPSLMPQAAGDEGAGAAASTAPLRVYDSWILTDVYGSDHLPLGLTLVKA